MRHIFLPVVVLLLLQSVSYTQANDLAPFKDRLFSLPETIEGSWRSGRLVVAYDELRDVNGRDAIPGRRVLKRYVRLGVRHAQKNVTYKTDIGPIKTVSVGQHNKARVITIYLHGQGGNFKQGANDYSFGGNFNRLKNLMARNNGLYVSAGFRDFGDGGMRDIAALIQTLRANNPDPKIILACGSAGGLVCWKLAHSPLGQDLAGIALLGSFPNNKFAGSAAYKAKVPLYIGHGSRDSASPVGGMEAFYQSLKARNYPVKYVRFETGIHGTPIRMTDWRLVLNWMLQ